MDRSTVLVIRPDGQFSSKLRDEGFDILNLELVRTEPLDDLGDADEKISVIENYDGLFFTSPVSASVFGERLLARRPGYASKIYALGGRAKSVLERLGFAVTCAKNANTAADLIAGFETSEFSGKRFLYVRGETSLQAIPELLSKIANVDQVAVYRTVAVEPPPAIFRSVEERLRKGQFGAVCFFSPSGVERFKELFPLHEANCIKAAAIGETTAATAKWAGFQRVFVSPAANAEQFAREFAEHIKNIE